MDILQARLLVIGHAEHGKDSVCEILRDTYKVPFASSSQFVADRVMWPRLGKFYSSAEEMFEDRRQNRALWKDLIAQYCADDPARTAREMLDTGYRVYCGMRARKEFQHAKPLFDAVVWVDALKRLPPEAPDSMELSAEDAHYVIDNNGLESELPDRIAEFVWAFHREFRRPTHKVTRLRYWTPSNLFGTIGHPTPPDCQCISSQPISHKRLFADERSHEDQMGHHHRL